MSTNPQYVYKGGWTDWGGNSVYGGRITVTAKSGSILSVFAGIFITIIEGGFSSMPVYCIYHYQTSKYAKSTEDGDGLRLEKQVILRNSSSDLSEAAATTENWSPENDLLIALGAVVNFLFFVVTLLLLVLMLSSSTGDEVLIHSPNCGFWEDSATLEDIATVTKLENRTWDAVKYVENS
jgi:hypothetical protein